MTKEELIAYLKRNDKYFRGKYIDDYPYEILLAIKQIIKATLSEFPQGYRLSSCGYDKELEQTGKRQLA